MRIGIYNHQHMQGSCPICRQTYVQGMISDGVRCQARATAIYGDGHEFINFTDLGDYPPENLDRPGFKRMMEAVENNEIDVLVMRRSAPIFISCKMTKPAADDVYEVGYLASRLGGVMGRGVIATTFNVADTREFDMGIYQRLKKMHVGVLEAQALKGANMAQKLAAALETADNM